MESDVKHRIAVVGCGSIAQFIHLPNIARNPRLELVVVCDVDPSAAESCRDEYGAGRAETDWRRVVAADDVDLILLATHTNLRGQLIIPALRAGKPVYTEKPLGTDREEMEAIVRTTRETGIPVCVGHNRRSSPAVLEFRRLLEKAKIATDVLPPSIDRSGGRARLPEEYQLQLLIRINDDARSWKDWIFTDREGIMFAEMVHFIDLALWFNDARPARVFAEGSQRGNFTLIIRFDDGSITTLQHTMVGHFDYPKELFEATVNNVTIAMDHHREVRQMGLPDEPTIWKPALSPDTCHLAPSFPDKGHYAHMDRFLDHIEGRGENPCDVESAVTVNALALLFLESARTGQPIILGEQWSNGRILPTI